MSPYLIKNGCFTSTNGINRYGRPLYGQYGIFHVYAGDRPEWALSRPGKTGNLLIGIVRGKHRKWLINADQVQAEYCPGFYRHIVRDRLLGKAVLTLTSIAMTDADGLLVKVSVDGVLKDTEIIWVFGGVRAIENCISLDFDTCGYTHESHFFPRPEDSAGNRVKIAGNTFALTVPFPLGAPKQAVAYQATKKLYRKLYAGVTGAHTASPHLSIVHARIFGNDVPIISKAGSAPAIMGRFPPGQGHEVFIGLMMMNRTADRLTAAELPVKFATAFLTWWSRRRLLTHSIVLYALPAAAWSRRFIPPRLWAAPSLRSTGMGSRPGAFAIRKDVSPVLRPAGSSSKARMDGIRSLLMCVAMAWPGGSRSVLISAGLLNFFIRNIVSTRTRCMAG